MAPSFLQLHWPKFLVSALSVLFRIQSLSTTLIASSHHHISPGSFQLSLPGASIIARLQYTFDIVATAILFKHKAALIASLLKTLHRLGISFNILPLGHEPHIMWPHGPHLSPSSWLTLLQPPQPSPSRSLALQEHCHHECFTFTIPSASDFLPCLDRSLTSFRSFLQSYLLSAAFPCLNFSLHWHFISPLPFLLSADCPIYRFFSVRFTAVSPTLITMLGA